MESTTTSSSCPHGSPANTRRDVSPPRGRQVSGTSLCCVRSQSAHLQQKPQVSS
ncbi:MAG: hypothetical protein Q8N23_12545 [Archangium sp.]|nr:hypothetical protein [Archangium sp.]MDP3574735.1 hypothetical protein [Archangium sp.]